MSNTKKIAPNLLVILLTLFSLVYLTSCGKKDETKTDSKNESTSAGDIDDISPDKPLHVVFDVKGNVTGNVDAIYAGKKSKIASEMNMQGQKIKSTAYTDGQMVYVVSEIGGMKTGMKMDAKKYSEQSGKENQWDITDFRERLKEYNKVGTEEILGKKCDIYQSKDGKFKFSVYKEIIPMKFDFGTMTFTATKIEPNFGVTDEILTPPKDINYVEMDEMLKDTEKMKGGMKDLQEKTKELEDAMKKYNK